MAILKLDRLAPRERMLLAVCACIVAVAFVDRLAVEPIRIRFGEISRETRSSEAQLRGNDLILIQRARIATEYERVKDYVEAATADPGATDSAMLTEIEKLASSCGVSMLERRAQSVEEKDFFREHTVRVEVEGSMGGVMQFLYKLQASRQLLRVRRIDLGPSPKNRAEMRKAVLLVTKIVTK